MTAWYEWNLHIVVYVLVGDQLNFEVVGNNEKITTTKKTKKKNTKNTKQQQQQQKKQTNKK